MQEARAPAHWQHPFPWLPPPAHPTPNEKLALQKLLALSRGRRSRRSKAMSNSYIASPRAVAAMCLFWCPSGKTACPLHKNLPLGGCAR
jgi:hypothetical protein